MSKNECVVARCEIRDEIKARVDGLGRKLVADKIGWAYYKLSQKISGFSKLSIADCEIIESAIKQIKNE
jgi:DNA-binding transcriptional regulator YdaS (Cro superfamily)